MAGQHLVLSPQWSTASLNTFSDTLFGHLPRADQRRWALGYLRGLLATPGKKSIRRLAAAISASPTASQSLQQFINTSPWDWEPAREELTRAVQGRTTPLALTVASAFLPKRGAHSCGVHRRFVPRLGRTINCQMGVGLFLSSGDMHLPVDWRLMLPERWSDDADLRERARIPGTARHRPYWEHILDLLDMVSSRAGLTAVPAVVDMSECPDATLLVNGLSRRGQNFVVAVPPGLRILPLGPRAAPADAQDAQGALSVQEFLHRHGTRQTYATVHAPGRGDVRMLSTRVRLPGSRQTHRLLAEWDPARQGAPRAWLSTLLDERAGRIAALAHLTSGAAATVSRLEEDCGLLDFEGRSYPGWHHHMTLVSAAYTYSRLYFPASTTPAAPEAPDSLPRTA
ncbi:IS701 family transposase [Streptomyces sp. NPDC058440]|uniref:IS701 family transposase n=1 Tax=Streptomyces sp. NPDC058440 TaxID=3346501 RepID=UPI00364B684D